MEHAKKHLLLAAPACDRRAMFLLGPHGEPSTPAVPHPRRCRGALRRSTDPPGRRARLPAMESRLLVPLGVAVAALVVLAGVASRGRPLAGSGGGGGPTASFFDYFFTTVLIIALIIVAVVRLGPSRRQAEQGGSRAGATILVSYLISVAGGRGDRPSPTAQRALPAALLSARPEREQGAPDGLRPPRTSRRRRAACARRDPLGRDCDRRRARGGSDLLRRRGPLEEADACAVVAQRPLGRPRRSPSTTRWTIFGTSPTCGGRSSPRMRGWRRRSRAPGSRAGRRRRRSSTWSAH